MKLSRRLVLGFLLTLAGLVRGWAQSPGLEELFRLDRLPAFKTSTKIGSISSYDRSGGNDDGFSGKYSFVRKEADALVLADLKGPGVIYRLWTPTPTDDLIEFLFDGETVPRVQLKFREVFLGWHALFPKPLVGFGVGGYFSYVPIPFAKSCVVRLRAAQAQFYQINFALYPPATELASFDPQLPPGYLRDRNQACALWNSTGSDVSRFLVPPDAERQLIQRSLTLSPNSTGLVFEAKSGGRIVGLRVAPASAMAGKNRDLLLRVSYDHDSSSWVCPLDDFFGYGWGKPATRSLLVGTDGETNYCYFPMPFDTHARVEVISERSSPVELHTEVLFSPIPRGSDEGKFYTHWRRENPTTLGQPYTFVEAAGRGHLVGVVLQAQGFESGKTLFFEGDDETTIDGEAVIHGTGSEDFFNGGWYDVPDRWEKQLSFALSGCLGYAKHLGRTGAYRMFLGDAYSFRQGIRQTIEHSGEKNNIPTDYCSVSYLYSDRAVGGAPRPAEMRRVIDPGEILFPAWWQLPLAAWSFEHATLTRKKEKIGQEEIRFLSFSATGQDWFGPHFLSPICDLPASGLYSIYLQVVRGPAQAQVQLFQNENPVAEPVELFAETPAKSERLLVGRLVLAEGKNTLMLKLAGKNEKSAGLGLDLISIICVREP